MICRQSEAIEHAVWDMGIKQISPINQFLLHQEPTI